MDPAAASVTPLLSADFLSPANTSPLLDDRPTVAAVPGLPPSFCGHYCTASYCTSGWQQMWSIVLLQNIAEIICRLLFLDVATTYFNGGTDPCVGGGHGSSACASALQKAGGAGAVAGAGMAVLAFLSGPIVGAMCDKLGRRPMAIASLLLTQMHTLALLATEAFGCSIFLFYGSLMVLGLIPPNIVFGTWIADRTVPEDRAPFFAMLNAAEGLEGVVVPVVTFLGSRRVCVVLADIIGFLAPLIAIFGLPESKPAAPRETLGREVSWRSGEESGGPPTLSGSTMICTHPSFRRITLLALLGFSANAGGGAILYPYLKVRYGLDVSEFSPILSTFTASSLVLQLLLVKPLMKSVGLKGLIMMSFATALTTSTVIFFAPDVRWLYVVGVVSGFQSLALPGVSALYMNVADPSLRGQVQGALNSVLTASSVLGPTVFGGLFLFCLEPRFGMQVAVTGAPWVVAMGLGCLCLALLLRMPASMFDDTTELSVPKASREEQDETSSGNELQDIPLVAQSVP